MIETHAHIYDEQFKEDRADMLERAKDNGVARIIMPNIDHTSVDGMMELEDRHPKFCMATMGLHPCSVKKDFEKELYRVEGWLNQRDFVAIGEIGTDLYWDTTFEQEQIEAFKIQVGWAKQRQRPIIIHCRSSLDMTIDLVEELNDEQLSGVFHCFNGDEAQFGRIKALGFYVGLGGVITFKNSGMKDMLQKIDMERVVLETDSPYLAPVPHRGKRNEPAFVQLVAQHLADVKEKNIDEIISQTTINAQKLFKIND